MEVTSNVIINNVRALIAKKGLKQYAVAEMCGYSAADFSNLMTNRKLIKEEDILKICNGLEITPNELFGYD